MINKCRLYKTLMLLIVFGVIHSITAQRDNSIKVIKSQAGTPDCVANDYAFKIKDVILLPSQKTAYVCMNDLPLMIEIVDATTGDIIKMQEAKWSSNVDGSFGELYKSQLKNELYSGKKVQVKFEGMTEDQGEHVSISIKIFREWDEKIDDSNTHSNYQWGYDENNITDYPDHLDGKPYVFLPLGEKGAIEMKEPKDLRLIGHEDNNLPNGQEGYLIFNSNIKSIDIESNGVHPGVGAQLREVINCDNELIFRVDMFNPKTVDVIVYILEESDDDIANYCVDKNGDGIPWG